LLNKLLKRIKATRQSIPQPRHGASRLVEIEIQVRAGIDERGAGRLREGAAAPRRRVQRLI
jgi:hypothetical protein